MNDKMVNRSILCAIIGFLVGCLLYYLSDVGVIVVLIMGCAGYILGLFLDNADIKHQHETYYFSTGRSSQKIFQPTDLPEALILYSSKENLTTVSTDFQVETKPQTFRLSVLKNLQNHHFRISENSSRTIFSLTLDFPECNYPKLSPDLREELHYNIRECSLDFQNAVTKIIPGLVLSAILQPDRVGDNLGPHEISLSPSAPPTYNRYDRIQKVDERGSRYSLQKTDSEESEEISESHIMEDLLPEDEPSMELKLPDLSPDEVQHLRDSNKRQLDAFLNESDDIKIDFSKMDQPVRSETLEDFEEDIINRIEEKTKLALSKHNPNLDLKKERDKIKKYITGGATSEETVT